MREIQPEHQKKEQTMRMDRPKREIETHEPERERDEHDFKEDQRGLRTIDVNAEEELRMIKTKPRVSDVALIPWLRKKNMLHTELHCPCFKLKRMKEWRKYLEEEARIMKDVPGWKVGESIYHSKMDATCNW
ncbi:unnamed protein product [Camellia sinensis]